MAKTKQRPFYGSVESVGIDEREPKVTIRSAVDKQSTRDFPFDVKADLFRVFESMRELNMPLIAYGDREQKAGEKQYLFDSGIPLRVTHLEQAEDRVWVRTGPEGFLLYVLLDNPEIQSIWERLVDSRDNGTDYWFILSPTIENNNGQTVRKIINVLGKLPTIPCTLGNRPAETFDKKHHKPIKVKKAEKLFTLMHSMSTHPSSGALVGIPFLYVDGGCEYRSHEMARHIIGEGAYPHKLWVFSSSLELETPNHPDCVAKWAWHTAPMVATTEGFYVIDPSVCDHAVPAADWYNRFSMSGQRHIYNTSHHVYRMNGSMCYFTSDPEFKNTERKLAIFRIRLRLQSAREGPPPFAHCPA